MIEVCRRALALTELALAIIVVVIGNPSVVSLHHSQPPGSILSQILGFGIPRAHPRSLRQPAELRRRPEYLLDGCSSPRCMTTSVQGPAENPPGLAGGSPLPLPSGVSEPQRTFLASSGEATLLPGRAGHHLLPGGLLPEPTHPGPGLVLWVGKSMLRETAPAIMGVQVGGDEVGNNKMYWSAFLGGGNRSGCPRRGTRSFLEGRYPSHILKSELDTARGFLEAGVR